MSPQTTKFDRSMDAHHPQHASLTKQQQSAIGLLSNAVAEQPFPLNLSQELVSGQENSFAVSSKDDTLDESGAIEAVLVNTHQIDKLGFLNKLSLKFKKSEKTTLFILDKFDENSELVAELVTANGFKAAFMIKDSAEGPRGWKDGSVSLSFTLGIAATTELGILAFTEIETILQFLSSAALVQFATKKLLFAES